jgi:hypothetical protein
MLFVYTSPKRLRKKSLLSCGHQMAFVGFLIYIYIFDTNERANPQSNRLGGRTFFNSIGNEGYIREFLLAYL